MYVRLVGAPVHGLGRLVAVAAVIALAGCFAPPAIPSDATTDNHEELPGLTLSAWTEERGGRLQLHAIVVNEHDEGYWYRVNCHHPWNVTLTAQDGRLVEFRQVPMEAGCAAQFEILQRKQYLNSMWSWDLRDHDLDAGTGVAVPDGNYTWRVSFGVRDVAATLTASYVVAVHDGALGNVTLH